MRKVYICCMDYGPKRIEHLAARTEASSTLRVKAFGASFRFVCGRQTCGPQGQRSVFL